LPIVVEDLGFSYFEGCVLSSVNLTLPEDLVHLILGATGSGKTTLALLLAGVLKPETGSVRIDGSDPASGAFERSRVQLAFQFPESQIFESSVEREIGYGLKNFGLTFSEIKQRSKWALECIGLADDMLPRDPSDLSFGERRRVALASVIAVRPKYLILDEPLAGLDWHGRRSLIQTIHKLRDQGVSTVILTHETEVVAEIGDMVSTVIGGEVSGPLSAAEFLYSESEPSSILLPDFVVALRKIQSAGFRIDAKPRRVEDVARAVVAALGFVSSTRC
jgi:energy-coupling factor transport system ATP-binding protein